MFRTKTHPYHRNHIREGYGDQEAKPRLSPIVKRRFNHSKFHDNFDKIYAGPAPT